jgi:hypothetical protein
MPTKQLVKGAQSTAEGAPKVRRSRDVRPSPYRKALTVTVWLHNDVPDLPPISEFLARYATRQGLVGGFRALKNAGLRFQLDTVGSAVKPKASKTISREEIAAAKALLLRPDIQEAARLAGESPVDYLERVVSGTAYRPDEMPLGAVEVSLGDVVITEAGERFDSLGELTPTF